MTTIIALWLPLSVVVGIIVGVYKLLTIPAPKEKLNKTQTTNYYFHGGWKDYQRLNEIETELTSYEKEKAENQIYNALDTLAHLENQKEQLQRNYKLLEYELEYENDRKKIITLNNKMRIIDNQIFTIDQKIKKILDD